MAFSDIHVHPDLKSFLSANYELQRMDCWKDIKAPFIVRIIDQMALGSILESQGSLTQLNSAAGSTGFAGLYAMEKTMIKADLIRVLGIDFHITLLTIARILKTLGNLFPHSIGQYKMLDYDLLKRISSRRSQYFPLLNEAYSHLIISKTIYPGYNLLNSYSNSKNDSLNIVLTLEGGHNLFNKTCGRNYRSEVLSNLLALKKPDPRFLFFSLAHIERNSLCTHAYAIKFMHHRKFKPVGKGITSLGKDVIRKALSDPNRVLIDIKHMSYESRSQYFRMLQEEFGSRSIPVISSHTGVTGTTYANKPIDRCRCCWRWSKVLYHQPPGLDGTFFNPWSINLYDEEIIKIIKSDGLIGLSLDARILGARQTKPKELIEYFSRNEFRCTDSRDNRIPISRLPGSVSSINNQNLIIRWINTIFRPWNATKEEEPEYLYIPKPGIADIYHPQVVKVRTLIRKYLRRIFKSRDFTNLDEFEQEIINEYNTLTGMPGFTHEISNQGARAILDVKHLCNNILHIIKVAQNNGLDGLKCICIGSDFDGLISSIKSCPDETQFSLLSTHLKTYIPAMADTDPQLPASVKNSISMNINKIVDDIMSNNVKKFLMVNFR